MMRLAHDLTHLISNLGAARWLRDWLSYGLVLIVVTACSTTATMPPGQSDLELTWYKAPVAMPSGIGIDAQVTAVGDPAFQSAMASLEGRRLPVVVYMHGCTGIEKSDRRLMRAVSRAGFLVVAPDSMARQYRPRQCKPRKKTGGFNLFVYDFRQAEINFALQQLRQSGWADTANLFLVGSSEGGLAAALHRGAAFRARVITKWTCHGSHLVRGLSAPPDEPVLAIVREKDPWYDAEKTRQSGECGAYFDDRPGSRSWVLETGKGHNVFKEDQVTEEIVSFLIKNRGR